MKIFYRISDNSYKKAKLPGTDKIFCLNNFIMHFRKENITILEDNTEDDTHNAIKMCFAYNVPKYEILRSKEGNAGSFRLALNEAIKLPEEEIVYFVEDDYLHRMEQNRTPINEIIDGLNIANYITLYDHPDKYTSFYNYGEISKILKTKNSHWKYSISTTMTFAAKVKTLIEDFSIFNKHISGDHPNDHDLFCELKEKGRTLGVALPGLACHVDLTVSEMAQENLIENWVMDLVEHTIKYHLTEDQLKIAASFDGIQKLMILDVLKKKNDLNEI